MGIDGFVLDRGAVIASLNDAPAGHHAETMSRSSTR